MASFRTRTSKDGKTTVIARVRLAGAPRLGKSFTSMRDAQRWAAGVEAKILGGELIEGSEARRRSVSELLDRYERDHMGRRRDKRSPKAQLTFWRQVLGPMRISAVTAAHVVEARDRLKHSGLSPASCNRYVSLLSHAFGTAQREYLWARNNPCRQVPKLREPPGRVRYLSDDERDRLLAACRASSNPQLFPAVLISLSTGGRQSEVLGLSWRDVDLSRREVRFTHTKNGDARSVPLTDECVAMLREMAKVRRIDSTLLFPREDGLKPTDLRKAWERALREADVHLFRWHDMRHSAASWFVMSGASLIEVAAILGHRSLHVTQRYSHLSAAHVEGVVARMQKKFLPTS